MFVYTVSSCVRLLPTPGPNIETGFSTFLPTIIRGMGYEALKVQVAYTQLWLATTEMTRLGGETNSLHSI